MTPHEQDMAELIDRLRERLESWATETVKQAGEIGDLKRALAAAEAERDTSKAAIGRLEALCDRALADDGTRFEDPMPLPGWVTLIQNNLHPPAAQATTEETTTDEH